MRRALVEAHDAVRPELLLNPHRFFRRELKQAPVDVGPKHDLLFIQLPQSCQTENLKPATVCQNRPIPIHKPMQATEFRNDLGSGPQRQVVGIGEDFLNADLLQLIWREPLDRRQRPDRHERRSLDGAMRRLPGPRPSLCVRVSCLKLKIKMRHGMLDEDQGSGYRADESRWQRSPCNLARCPRQANALRRNPCEISILFALPCRNRRGLGDDFRVRR